MLLVSSASLLSTRLNPLSATFYLTKKPSFLAIGVVFLGALILFAGRVRPLGPPARTGPTAPVTDRTEPYAPPGRGP